MISFEIVLKDSSKKEFSKRVLKNSLKMKFKLQNILKDRIQNIKLVLFSHIQRAVRSSSCYEENKIDLLMPNHRYGDTLGPNCLHIFCIKVDFQHLKLC